jgi:hypothetical protein
MFWLELAGTRVSGCQGVNQKLGRCFVSGFRLATEMPLQNVVALAAGMQANSEEELLFIRLLAVRIGHGLLELDCSRQCIDSTAELCLRAITV